MEKWLASFAKPCGYPPFGGYGLGCVDNMEVIHDVFHTLISHLSTGFSTGYVAYRVGTLGIIGTMGPLCPLCPSALPKKIKTKSATLARARAWRDEDGICGEAGPYRLASTLSIISCGSRVVVQAWSPRRHFLLPKMEQGRQGMSSCTALSVDWCQPMKPA